MFFSLVSFYSCTSSDFLHEAKTNVTLSKEMNNERVIEVMSQYKTIALLNYMVSYFFFLPYINFLACQTRTRTVPVLSVQPSRNMYLTKVEALPAISYEHYTQTA
jgi:hypothetical protein